MENLVVIGLIVALGLVAACITAVVTSQRVKDFFQPRS
jgi:hypothetical protein